jgi:hypothetical protein
MLSLYLIAEEDSSRNMWTRSLSFSISAFILSPLARKPGDQIHRGVHIEKGLWIRKVDKCQIQALPDFPHLAFSLDDGPADGGQESVVHDCA